MYWPKLSSSEIQERIEQALGENIDYRKSAVLGIPGTFLDPDEFYEDAPFLENAPFLKTLISNPNNIGCHTLSGPSGPFPGTQKIEIDLINLCAEQLFKGNKGQQDGYVTSGGTEANIYAIWVYRNLFLFKEHIALNEIALVYSEDSHYSMPKASNLLQIDSILLPVHEKTRQIDTQKASEILANARLNGKKRLIVVSNLSTTMFGSVDDLNELTPVLVQSGIPFRLHIDAAFGGFIYPFVKDNDLYGFRNPLISSITIDAHKMLQAPYGTGIVLLRKGLVENVITEQAQYIPGKDQTLCGSRSGANAVAVWMIMMSHGSDGWKVKMRNLIGKTDQLCNWLGKHGIGYYREPALNIIAIEAGYVPKAIAEKYLLVPDTYHEEPKWYKIVMMPHISKGTIDRFLNELKASLHTIPG